MRTLSFALLLVGQMAHAAPGDWADPVKPLATYKTESSAFIDDPFAMRDDGQSIAYIATNGATEASLHLATVPANQPEIVAPQAPAHPAALHWLGPERLLVVDKDPDTQKLTAQVFTSKGPGKEKLGPVDAVALATIDGKPVVVTYTRVEKKTAEHVLVAYARDNFKPVARRTYKEDAEGRINEKGGPFKILWFRDGYTSSVALKAGEFDKARDMRRPDRFARLDLFKGKVLDDREIEDVLGFAQLSMEHKKHDGEAAFVYLSDDHKKLLLAQDLAQHELKLARDLYMYDPNAFAYQVLDDGRIFVSATIDPTNPPALQRKKTDPDDLEIYQVDPKTHAATRVLRIPGDGRPTAWNISDGRIAVLRKSKGFDRGGVELDVYELPAQTASSH
jgi:hypothetical protein